MVATVLRAHKNNFRTFEVLIAAKYGECDVNIEYEQGFKSPFVKLPNLVLESGKSFTGSHAVAKFLAKNSLSSTTKCPARSADILQWFELVDNDLVPNTLAWLLPSVSALQYTKNQIDESKTITLTLLKAVDQYLLPKTYLVGERISLADVAVACALLPLFQHVLEPETRKPLLNLTRWFETCIHQPNFKSVVGDIQLCSKASQFDAKLFEKFTSFASQPATKQEQPKKEQESAKPKATKEKAKAEQVEELDASEQALAQEPKQKDPFADMPKSTFILDEFKRIYSNEDTLTKALPYFWQNFNANNFSIWYCEYKYANELTLCFMSCNLIAGIFQRLDKLRKNAFSSMCLFGTDNNSSISGIWVWRGQELVFELSDDWKVDYETYTWKKLDPKAPETVKMVQEYFAWEGQFDGKKFNQGKIFK